jgi:hypothetical protein
MNTKLNRLNLLIELQVHMDALLQLSDDQYAYSSKNVSNQILLELFGTKFCCQEDSVSFPQPVQLKPELVNTIKQQMLNNSRKMSNTKHSYTLNLMIRLHDFERVIHETSQNTLHLKQNTLVKFDASSKLRQLQVAFSNTQYSEALNHFTLLL